MVTDNVFKRCLKELGCFSSFIKNFNSLERYSYGKQKDTSFSSFVYFVTVAREHHYFSGIINDAFDWSRTKEGPGFWCDIFNALDFHENIVTGTIISSHAEKVNEEIIKIMEKYYSEINNKN